MRSRLLIGGLSLIVLLLSGTLFVAMSMPSGAAVSLPPPTAAAVSGLRTLPPPATATTPPPRPTANIIITSPPAAPTIAPWTAPYTIGWISDTQRYSKSYPDTFHAMTQYLRDEQEALNLGYVAHTGDLVHNGDKEAQWKNARSAMDNLLGIPHGVLAGNHDIKSKSNYSKYFGADYFEKMRQSL